MTKDEARSSVMGAISMALKDPTLQQGFEIICKNLSELERENAELKLELEALVEQTPWEDIKDKSEVIGQLTKAKEIIKTMLIYQEGFSHIGELKQEAVQFLKDR